MAYHCRLFSFCVLAFAAVTLKSATLSSSGIISASAHVSRPLGLTQIYSMQVNTHVQGSVINDHCPGWYLHSITPESVLLELSDNGTHRLIQTASNRSFSSALAEFSRVAEYRNGFATVVVSLTTIAD